MIAVAATPAEHEVVREFFELFKTPWEFQRRGARYDVLICSAAEYSSSNFSRLTIIYGSNPKPLESEQEIESHSRSNRILCYKGDRIPLYGKCLSFKTAGSEGLFDELTREPVAFRVDAPGQRIIRIGFDLFEEIQHLLVHGQPAVHAHIPTLELHIALLRDLILQSAVSLVEIAPVPSGSSFIVCLTHDVDHAAVRAHKGDHTMFGFLYRALVGSFIDLCRGRKTIRDLIVNWLAAFSLPLVYLGLVRDFWNQLERYAEIEGGLPSTFFVIPTSGDAGHRIKGPAPAKRAARYNLADISEQLRRLQSSHHEIGLHGIDAWRNADRARAELAAVREVMRHPEGASVAGVRMHWLYYSEHSPAILESAGFSYDSTVGYNETIGYRAGTCQVYKPVGVKQLMELPMHVMDTALLFPAHMNLSQGEAKAKIDALIANASRFGGVLTINWHDRSIAPERLWHRLYEQLIAELKRHRPWFATGAETVAWFQKRRAATFEDCVAENVTTQSNISSDQSNDGLPALTVKTYQATGLETSGKQGAELTGDLTDAPLSLAKKDRIFA